MEEMVLKYAEFGMLGAITMLLLVKGLGAINKLSTSYELCAKAQTALADIISKLTDKVSNIDTKVERFSFQLENLEKQIEKLNVKLDAHMNAKNVNLQRED